MQITFYIPVEDSDWLREYAARVCKRQEEVVVAAIARARMDIEPPRYIEPGTSTTQPGVVDFELALPGEEVQWLLQRASKDHVSHCAVLTQVLRRYKVVAPSPSSSEGWGIIVRDQTLYYRQIASVCADAAGGAVSPDEVDRRLGEVVAIRLYGLLPQIDRKQLREAVVAAVQELCVNHPGLRLAHGRDKPGR